METKQRLGTVPPSIFSNQLIKGKTMEFRLAQYFLLNHLTTLWPDDKDVKDGNFTQSQVDLVVGGKVIEVKSRSLEFLSSKDYPFYTVILDTVWGYKSKIHKPEFYVILSQSKFNPETGEGALVVPVIPTQELWEEKKRYDKIRRKNETNYEIAKEHCESLDWLVSYLKSL